MKKRFFLAILFVMGLAACSSGNTQSNDSGSPADAAAGAPDGATPPDAVPPADTGPAADAGADTGQPDDKGPGDDAGVPGDGGTEDVSPGDTGPGSPELTGFWFMYSEPATFTARAEPWDGETTGIAAVEMLVRITQTGDQVELTQACDSAMKLGAGRLKDGQLTLFTPDMKTPIAEKLSVEPGIIKGEHLIKGTRYALLYARLKDLKCVDDKGAPVKEAPPQPIEFAGQMFISPDERLTPDELAKAGSGMKNLEAAAASGLSAGADDVEMGKESVACASVDGKTIPCEGVEKDPGNLRITSADNEVVNTRALDNRPVLDNWPQVFAGALLQGGELAKGAFKPVSIARAGAKFQAEYEGGGERTVEVPETTAAAVGEAAVKIANETPAGKIRTEWRVFRTWSSDHLAYTAGLDDRFAGGDITSLGIDAGGSRSHWVLQITQHAFSISMETPEFRHSVFKAGDKFEDPANEIGAGNPPLYVSRVNYGRNLFIVLKNRFDSRINTETLNAIYNGVSGDALANGAIKFSEVAAQSEISISGRGIPAALLEDIRKAAPGVRYDSLLALMRRISANATIPPAEIAPIQFSLSYLQNRETASMAFRTRFRASQVFSDAAMTEVMSISRFYMNLFSVDDDLFIYDITDGNERELEVIKESRAGLDLTKYIPKDKEFTRLRLKLGNGGCWGTGQRWTLAIEGDMWDKYWNGTLSIRRDRVIYYQAVSFARIAGCGWQTQKDFEFRWAPEKGKPNVTDLGGMIIDRASWDFQTMSAPMKWMPR
ncbi:MAG: hypothetical protein GMKNLPBB_02588 [Myxococcota bacterium]|nr:hypothetical protein [Myxococcota bacterium]